MTITRNGGFARYKNSCLRVGRPECSAMGAFDDTLIFNHNKTTPRGVRDFDVPGSDPIVVIVAPDCHIVGSRGDAQFFMIGRFGGGWVSEALG